MSQKNDGPNIPHKIPLDLPHIQKIYEKDNKEYMDYYYSKMINKDKEIPEEKIDPKLFHIDCVNDRGDFPESQNQNKQDQTTRININFNSDINDISSHEINDLNKIN